MRHKFKVGQIVDFTPFKGSKAAGTAQKFRITSLAPEAGQPQYRIKSSGETYERMVKENELSRS